MYLFDTDILSNLVKKRPPPYLIERLRVIPQEKQYISSITIGEIVYGAFRGDQREKHLTQLRGDLRSLQSCCEILHLMPKNIR